MCCGNVRTRAEYAMASDGLWPVACTGYMLRCTPEYVQFISKEVLADYKIK